MGWRQVATIWLVEAISAKLPLGGDRYVLWYYDTVLNSWNLTVFYVGGKGIFTFPASKNISTISIQYSIIINSI